MLRSFSQKQVLTGSFVIISFLPGALGVHTALNTRQTASISWFACPDSGATQCAFFDVPMDYLDPNNNLTVSIFMRKFPATVPADQHLGTIIANPGGPGGSAAAWIADIGEQLSAGVDGRYDILGFDPRGVNLTGPSTACFDAEAKIMHQAYQLQLTGVPFPHVGGSAEQTHVKKIAGLQATHAAACTKNGNKQMLQSVGTASVAQDMVRIVEALGEDGLNYLGYSYGTIIGATFAALYPELVNRMVLDGVSDAESYFNDPLQWGRSGVQDSHKTLTGFLSTCIEAGPELCAFARPKNGSKKPETVASLRKRLDAIYAKLAAQPLTVGDSLAGPGILQAADIQSSLFNLLYTPEAWSSGAELLVRLEENDGSGIYEGLYSFAFEIEPKSYNENVYNRSMQVHGTRESLVPILCGDSAPLNFSASAYQEYFRELGKLSPTGEQWALIVGSCGGWPFRAKQRYTGPWTRAGGLKKTRFPILFASLDADLVTPLKSAAKMSQAFGSDSATLLVQKGYGHCTTANPSLCTLKHMRDYFVEGKVPANGTHCDAEPGFIYPTSGDANTNTKRANLPLSKREKELLGAVERVHDSRLKLLSKL